MPHNKNRDMRTSIVSYLFFNKVESFSIICTLKFCCSNEFSTYWMSIVGDRAEGLSEWGQLRHLSLVEFQYYEDWLNFWWLKQIFPHILELCFELGFIIHHMQVIRPNDNDLITESLWSLIDERWGKFLCGMIAGHIDCLRLITSALPKVCSLPLQNSKNNSGSYYLHWSY